MVGAAAAALAVTVFLLAFAATFAFVAFFATLAFAVAFAAFSLGLAAFTLAFFFAAGFLVASARVGASAVFALVGQADAVGAGGLAVLHALFSFLALLVGGVLIVAVGSGGAAVAGSHCESECDSEESGK